MNWIARSASRSATADVISQHIKKWVAHSPPACPSQRPVWLARHPRFVLHFTPTSSSWLNMVEIFFAELTDKALRRGIFHSVPDLITAIETYLAAHNTTPRPFT